MKGLLRRLEVDLWVAAEEAVFVTIGATLPPPWSRSSGRCGWSIQSIRSISSRLRDVHGCTLPGPPSESGIVRCLWQVPIRPSSCEAQLPDGRTGSGSAGVECAGSGGCSSVSACEIACPCSCWAQALLLMALPSLLLPKLPSPPLLPSPPSLPQPESGPSPPKSRRDAGVGL